MTFLDFHFDVTAYLGIFIFSLVLCSAILNWMKTWNYPPGPIGLPVVGYLPFLGSYPNVTLRDLSKKYDGIFSYYIGNQLFISVSDYHYLKEILNHPMTLARPQSGFDFIEGKAGFFGMNGEEWQEQRRFAVQTMRNLGLGKGIWERMIQADASDLANDLKQSSGEAMFFTRPIADSQVRNNLSLLFGRHLDPVKEREDLEIIQKIRESAMESESTAHLASIFPWIIKIVKFFNLMGFKDFLRILKRFESIFKNEINSRLASKDDSTRDDFIGCYIQEMEQREREGKPHSFDKLNLQGNILILFLSGIDAIVASVSWLLLIMAQYADVQDKVCEEIDRIIGRDGIVYYEDKVKLPYTMATLLEMNRWITISALYAPRYVTDTFTFNGYTIPRGAYIQGNAWAMQHDPRYFDDPMTFRPERFLEKDGSKVLKPEGYGPFSFGKRNCPGEGVAMMTTYLYFVTLMQKFNIRTPDGKSPDMTYKFASGIIPRQQKLCFLER